MKKYTISRPSKIICPFIFRILCQLKPCHSPKMASCKKRRLIITQNFVFEFMRHMHFEYFDDCSKSIPIFSYLHFVRNQWWNCQQLELRDPFSTWPEMIILFARRCNIKKPSFCKLYYQRIIWIWSKIQGHYCQNFLVSIGELEYSTQ